MKLIDLSQPVYHDGPNCPVHPPVKAEVVASHARGDGWHMELLTLASHTGSHVDAPLHKIAGGKSITDLPLEAWCGPAHLVDLTHLQQDARIEGTHLAAALGRFELRNRIVLLDTGWGQRRGKSDEWLHHSPYLTPGGARWLAERGIRGVGIDHYSIGGSGDENAETHEVLLGGEAWIVEELRFPRDVHALPQPVRYMGLPINFRGFSGAFCRPVLIVEDGA